MGFKVNNKRLLEIIKEEVIAFLMEDKSLPNGSKASPVSTRTAKDKGEKEQKLSAENGDMKDQEDLLSDMDIPTFTVSSLAGGTNKCNEKGCTPA